MATQKIVPGEQAATRLVPAALFVAPRAVSGAAGANGKMRQVGAKLAIRARCRCGRGSWPAMAQAIPAAEIFEWMWADAGALLGYGLNSGGRGPPPPPPPGGVTLRWKSTRAVYISAMPVRVSIQRG